jgi:outer membrane protein
MKVSKIALAGGLLLGAMMGVSESAMAGAGDFHAGDVMIRLRGLGVVPDVNTSNWKNCVGCDAKISSAVVPELDVTYFLTSNLSVEVIAGVTHHNIRGMGAINNVDVGSTWALPPTVTLQYHLGNIGGINPYVGAGVNYTAFFGVDDGDAGKLKLTNSWGGALQAGFDMPLTDKLYLNVDVKKVFMDTDLTVGNIKTKVDIDPWLVGVGVGYRFGRGYEPLK